MRNGSRLMLIYTATVLILLLGITWGSKAVTVISEHKSIPRKHCFIIDAGHGGVDGGATSCTGKLESSFNLEIALRLNDLLRFLGLDTKMIRTQDISVYTKGESIAQKKVSDLKERVRICNETEGSILLSIHQNTFSDSRYSGAQVFYATKEESRVLAGLMQDALTQLNPESSRKAKKSNGIYLLEHIECPGILIECGFISNPQEESKLRSSDYQKLLCCVIAATLSNYANT